MTTFAWSQFKVRRMEFGESIEYLDLTHQVFTILRNKITSGEFTHGEPLKPTHLSKKLGVSPTPIREALLRLAEKEYIEKNDSRSYVIKKVSRLQYMQLSILRAQLETQIIRKIIEEDWVGDVDALENIYNEQCKAMESGDYGKGLILNRDFHGHYLRWADIPQVAEFVENICVIAGPILSHLKGRRLTTSKDQHFHAQLLSAIKAMDVEKAVKAVENDIIANAERTCSFMQE